MTGPGEPRYTVNETAGRTRPFQSPGVDTDLALASLPAPDQDRIGAALRGDHGDDQQRIAVFGLALVTKLLAKNADYGSSAFSKPALAPHLSAREGILTRMSDKVARFQNLAGKDDQAEVAEAIPETLGDWAGYLVLWLACPDDGEGGTP